MTRQRPAPVPYGGLGLQGVEERRREAVNVVYAPHVSLCAVLSGQVPVALCDPVPQQAEDEPAPGEGGHEQEEDEAPADLHEGGPEVHQVRKVVAVLDVAKLNVAAPVLGDQAGFVTSVSVEQPQHPGAAGSKLRS